MTSFGRHKGKAVTKNISLKLSWQKTYTIENEKQKLRETVAAVQAMLNGRGGQVILDITTQEISQLISVLRAKTKTKIKHDFIRKIEQQLGRTAGIHITSTNVNFKVHTNKIMVDVLESSNTIINSYNLFLPTKTQVVVVNPLEPLERIQNDILQRKIVENETRLGSHCKIFTKGRDSGLREGKVVQIKSLRSTSSTTLADRMTGKGNKFTHYVSAFANFNGGNIYFGVGDDGVVEGECVSNVERDEINKKVRKTIKKMIWPPHIVQPVCRVHWEVFFEPVRDFNCEAIPATFVIIVYIAPCLGGVFTEEPEHYEIINGEVKNTWKTVLQGDGGGR